jgi:hypothetical protein
MPRRRDEDGPLQQLEEEIPGVTVLTRRRRFVERMAKNEFYQANNSVNRQRNQDRSIS